MDLLDKQIKSLGKKTTNLTKENFLNATNASAIAILVLGVLIYVIQPRSIIFLMAHPINICLLLGLTIYSFYMEKYLLAVAIIFLMVFSMISSTKFNQVKLPIQETFTTESFDDDETNEDFENDYVDSEPFKNDAKLNETFKNLHNSLNFLENFINKNKKN